MTDTIHVEIEGLPWHPSEDVEGTRALYEFEVPLVGIVRQHAVDYLFQCIAGEIEPVNLWAYTRLEPGEAEVLEATSDVEEFREHVRAYSRGRNAVLALAVEGLGIVSSIDVEDSLGEALTAGHAFDDLVRKAEDRLRRVTERLSDALNEARQLMIDVA